MNGASIELLYVHRWVVVFALHIIPLIYVSVKYTNYYLCASIFVDRFQTMLKLINHRLIRKGFDDVMEVAWSTMWNVTDETPLNCQRFLNGKGMQYFIGCLEVCGHYNEEHSP